MPWLAGQLDIPPQFIEGWVQLGLLIAGCAWLLGGRRSAGLILILAIVPLTLPSFRPLLNEFRTNLWEYVPWYVLLTVGFFFVFIILRSIISLFLGSEIATRTTSDLLTMSIAGVFGAFLAGLLFVLVRLLDIFRR